MNVSLIKKNVLEGEAPFFHEKKRTLFTRSRVEFNCTLPTFFFLNSGQCRH